MPVTYTCSLPQLMVNSSCFGDRCLSEQERKTLLVYLQTKNLTALGGTDYTSNLALLMRDSVAWQKRAKHELDAIQVWISLQNAINDGASLTNNPNTLMTAAKCLVSRCLGEEQLNGIISYLGCSINTLIKPN